MSQAKVASLFASLGFKLDETGLNAFEKKLRGFSTITSAFTSQLKEINSEISKLDKSLSKLNSKLHLDSKQKRKANEGQSKTTAYSKIQTYTEKVSKAQNEITKNAPTLTKSLESITSTVWKGAEAWEKYAKEITKSKEEMRIFKRSISDLRRGTGNINLKNNIYNSTTNTTGYRPNQQQSAQSTSMMLMGGIGRGIQQFARSFTPATAVAGGLATAGYATKEIVQTGREMTKMNNVLLMAAKDTNQYATALQFVRKESSRLGQDVQEMGMGFGKVLQSARGKMAYKDVEKTFTGFGELMVAMGASADDQKGIYRALGQMLSKGKIEAEEEGQMAERGLPAKEMIKKASMEVYKVDEAGYAKMRQKGEVKFEDIAVVLAKSMQEIANNNGALDKMLRTSMVQQQLFVNRLKELAQKIMDSGLDKTLAKMFRGLIKTMDVISPVITGTMALIKTLYEASSAVASFVSNNAKLIATTGVVIGLFKLFAANSFLLSGTLFTIVATVGTLIARYGKLALRLVWVTTLVWGLYKAFTAFDRHKGGEVNWMTILINSMRILSLEIQLMFAEIELSWVRFTNRMKGKYDTIKNSAKTTLESIGEKGLIKTASETLNKAQQSNQNNNSMSDTVSLPDLQSSNMSLTIPPTTLHIKIEDSQGLEQFLTTQLGNTQFIRYGT